MNDELTIALREELRHSGTKGMHWGVRLYQNKDGSLTPLGRIHYRKERKRPLESELKRSKHLEKHETDVQKHMEKNYKSPTKKLLSEMTDDEIRKAIDRKRLEQEYMQYFPKQKSAARKFVDDAVIPAVTDLTKDTIKKLSNAALDRAVTEIKKTKTSDKKKTTAQLLAEQQDQLKLYVSREQYKLMKSGKIPIPTYTSGGQQK